MSFKDHKFDPQRGIYLLPNLFTTAALFAGFYAVVAAMKGLYDLAAITIFIALIADGLDGRVARLTNTQTAFGAQYDSMSDMVAFGIAPALVSYKWSLMFLGKIGWLAAFLFAAATALRLARFNTQVVEDKRYFQGLPSPAAAGLIASFVWIWSNMDIPGYLLSLPLMVLIVCVSGLMVSSVRYSSFKTFDFKGKVPFLTVVAAVFLITAVMVEPAVMLFTILFIFALSGPITTLMQLRAVRKARKGKLKG